MEETLVAKKSKKKTEPVNDDPPNEDPPPTTKTAPGNSLANLRRGGVKQQDKTLTFEQYADKVGMKAAHKGGMKAFVTDSHRSRSLSNWKKALEKY